MLSAAYRLANAPESDRPYGARERQRYDLFVASTGSAPLVVYIHGGYWQRGDRKDFSFVARELNANGISVAIPSYSLCPAASVMEIIDEMELCLVALWKKLRRRPAGDRPFGGWPSLGGHAGQRLVAGGGRSARPGAGRLRLERRLRPGAADRDEPQRGVGSEHRRRAGREPHIPAGAAEGAPASSPPSEAMKVPSSCARAARSRKAGSRPACSRRAS